ncbi:alpha-(1-_3)-arabinofuranosyltransferase domain-containing protein [Gordonia sp. (in: high G+C Gram-positive bacteria)]|uniref:alpha-(1->3)-arabinofuranosyltransferase domain-containing protein n=2 Tax=Gordonia sp. (in: high G+C Gram-positive bacteria) TaxID=84139 RepID=UPI003C7949DF
MAVVAAVALLISFLQRPGQISPDTKLDLTTDPRGFLARAAHLWSPDAPMGQVQNQAYGYFFPHGAFFAVGDLLHLPPWIVQRFWWALLLTIGFVGIVRLAETLRIGSFTSRLIAGWVFVLAPRVMTTLGTISSETLPMMLAPWVLIPVIRALDTTPDADRGPLWRDAARSACAVALMGAVNAVATGAAVLVAVIWWLLATLGRDRDRLRRGLTFGCWWALALAAACLWWIAALLILSRVSPPFLDYIESASVTTEWTSLTEVLRGTDSWTPFVSPERAVGAVLVSEPAAVIATAIVAAAGLAGLTMRAMPFRRRLLAILTVGLLALCLGYPGALGSPIRETVIAFLDGPGAALRNIHKFDPLLRLPLALGVAHLLGKVRVRAPSSLPGRERGLAAAMVVVIAAFGAGSLLWTGGLAPAKSFAGIPGYWQQTADWLKAQEQDSPTPRRALVVPGAPFADQLWGLTRDEPLQPLAQTPWAVRDAIPLVPPGAIRAMDAVQRAVNSGRGSPGLAATLAGQGIGYLVLRADLDPNTSRSARPLTVAQAIENSPGLSQAVTFGPLVAPATIDGIVVDDGLRPRMPAVTVYRVNATSDQGSAVGGPGLVDATTMPRISGGPESVLAVQDSRRRAGLSALGPALLTGDAKRAGLSTNNIVVTDTPVDRETDFGRVDDHSSAIRSPADPRLTKNAAPDYAVGNQQLVQGQWLLDGHTDQVRVGSSGSAADATQPGRTSPANSTAAAFDGDPATAWISRGLESAVGQWMSIDLTQPRSNLAVTVTTAKALGPDVTSLLLTTNNGSTVAQGITPGEPVRILAPPGQTSHLEIRAIDTENGSAGNQFAISSLALADANTDVPLTIRHRTVLPTRDASDRVSEWVLGPEFGARSDCVTAADRSPSGGRVRCSPALGLSSETPGIFGRVLSVPTGTEATPEVTLRPRPGGELSDLLRQPGIITAEGPSAVADPLGNASAAVDGDQNTSWTAPESTGKKSPKPQLTLHLPAVREVSGVRLHTAPDYPAKPTTVTVELRDGDRTVSKQQAKVGADGTVRVATARADSIVITVNKRSDLINVNDLGFATDAPAGISEVQVLPLGPEPVFDDNRPIEIRCDADPFGPYGLGATVSGQVVRLQVSTTAGALRRGEPVSATPCPGPALVLAAGEQELSVNPGKAFSVDAVTLRTPDEPTPTSVTRPQVERWDATDRAVRIDPATTERVLFVPESTNPGWHARVGDRELTPIVVDGWQQGWLVPAGVAGTVALTFDFDTPYRWAMGVGLALMALLFVVAFWPRRGVAGPAELVAARPGSPYLPALAFLAAASLLTGWPGLLIAGIAGVVAWRIPPRARPPLVFASLLTAAVVLATGPWHSGAPYAGYSGWAQAFALVAVAVAVWSGILPSDRLSAARSGSSTKA